MKKVLCFVLSVLLIFSGIASADDLNINQYEEAVEFVTENKIMYENNNIFEPMADTSRAEYIYALYKSFQIAETDYTANFSDVDTQSYYNSAVGWAENNKITDGIGNNMFAPNDRITREMAMTFLYRALLALDIAPKTTSTDLSAFTDSTQISDWALDSINTLVSMGIIHGTDENMLEPQKILNNSEVAAMIYNMYSLKIIGQNVVSGAAFESKYILINDTEKINYWLFTPQNAVSNMPLIVYLHGSHSQGDDLNLVLQEEFCNKISNGDYNNLPAYIIFPQLPNGYKSWTNMKSELKQLIDTVADNYAVNKNNISLVGYSLGGTGTVNLAAEYPGFFSKIAPISGSVRNTEESISALSNTPVWFFVGSDDVIVKPDSAKEFVESLKYLGKDAQITVFDGAEHTDVPSLVFSDDKINLANWLISD